MQSSISTQFTIETEQELDGRWIAEILEIPGVLVYGSTQQEAIANVQALALRVIADKLEHGEISLGLTSLTFVTDGVKHDYKKRKLIDLREKIAEGTQQIREGKVVEGEAVFQQLQEKLDRKALFENFGDEV